MKRGYSRDFTPSRRVVSKRYLLDNIPAPLWKAARAKAQREGLSMRALLLGFLRAWVRAPRVPR
jgi:hypothetical protein